MIRKIITIDEEKCTGCGLCADACHEGAIAMVDGKASLMREDYCDGLGDCLPACPANAISFEMREAPAYNEAAVLAAKLAKNIKKTTPCPGTVCKSLPVEAPSAGGNSALRNFPVQIHLVPVDAEFFQDADLLIAADCAACCCSDFHSRFLRGRVLLIGCPKLDPVNYAEKLGLILRRNSIRSVTVVRMQVPCCGGLSHAAQQALLSCGRSIPAEVITLSSNGTVIG